MDAPASGVRSAHDAITSKDRTPKDATGTDAAGRDTGTPDIAAVDARLVDADVDSAKGRPLHLRWRYVYVVFLGGVLGTLARWAATDLLPSAGHRWPWPTFCVNILGAFLLGLLLESLARAGADHGWRRLARLHFGTGFLGAFTTYSSFAVESVLLFDQRHAGWALAYLLASSVLGVLAATLGVLAGSRHQHHAKGARA